MSVNILNIQFISNIIKRFTRYRKNKSYILNFFNADKPCSDRIKNCSELRAQYFADVEKYKKLNVCTRCNMISLKRIYITKITNLL